MHAHSYTTSPNGVGVTNLLFVASKMGAYLRSTSRSNIAELSELRTSFLRADEGAQYDQVVPFIVFSHLFVGVENCSRKNKHRHANTATRQRSHQQITPHPHI